MGEWTLLVDFGEERMGAASLRGDTLQIVDFDGSLGEPSAVRWNKLEGLVVGCAGLEGARIGGRLDRRELTLGDKSVLMRDAVGVLLARVLSSARAQGDGTPPSSVWMTGPAATHGGAEAAILRSGAEYVGMVNVMIVGEPEALAASVPAERLGCGERVAVLALRASCSEIAVFERGPRGLDDMLFGRAGGGTDALDDALAAHLAEKLQGDRHSTTSAACGPTGASLRECARSLRESLSSAMTTRLELGTPVNALLTVSRQDLDTAIEPQLRETVELLANSGVAGRRVAAVVLGGAAADMPLLRRVVAERLGIEPEPGDPATAALRGLGELARGALQERTRDRTGAEAIETTASEVKATVSRAEVGEERDKGERLDVPTLAAAVAPSSSAAAPMPASQPQATDQDPLDDDVQFTVYRPQRVRPERWYTALVFAHKSDPTVDEVLGVSDPIEKVRAQATARLGASASTYATATQDSLESIALGSLLTFVPRVEGVTFNPERSSFRWEEPVHVEEFRLRASAGLGPGTRRGAVEVYRGVVLIGEVNLTIRIGDTEAPPVASRARPYRTIFLSYSHLDRVIAEQVEQVHTALGDEPLRDERVLHSGEVWDERVEQMIRNAEIFQLFWSTNSMRSPWVTKEWRYALALERPNFVRPTYWEQPMPEVPEEDLPPAELACLHFSPLRLGDLPPPGGRHPTAAVAGAHALSPPPAELAWSRPLAVGGGPVSDPPAARSSRPRARGLAGGALRFGGTLAAILAVVVAVTTVIGSSGSGNDRPSSAEPRALETATHLSTGAAPPSGSSAAPRSTQQPTASSCAGCQPFGSSCPECATASGAGPQDLGAIDSKAGLLTWKSEDGVPLTIVLEGHPVSSGSTSGRVDLRRHAYSDLRVDTEGAWSIVIH
jgi:hypothetical protein